MTGQSGEFRLREPQNNKQGSNGTLRLSLLSLSLLSLSLLSLSLLNQS
jgi:hypothetical protein